jgi:hypothetical protein
MKSVGRRALIFVVSQALEHVPEKWVHFSDKDMLQLIEAARILIIRMSPSEWNTRQANSNLNSGLEL